MSERWTEERRQRQSELIRSWKPWESSTGPRSAVGKSGSAQNSFKTGAHTAELRRIMNLLAEQGRLLREVPTDV
ncbi:hypothetical protein EYC98_02580 [Halieaceae bacterium IMCC14734]|uniref:Uncharacterized protein n=1 Tax=Candidatus Litorirhabdus singularis TaxID=2518993 RepID=A0ABT3TD48_9GAMM|nr:hypothetical protein [Candidatus Litorirhabdus singularis]